MRKPSIKWVLSDKELDAFYALVAGKEISKEDAQALERKRVAVENPDGGWMLTVEGEVVLEILQGETAMPGHMMEAMLVEEPVLFSTLKPKGQRPPAIDDFC